MATRSILSTISPEFFHRLSFQKSIIFNFTQKLCYCSEKHNENSSEKKLTGFAKAFIKQSHITDPVPEKQESFADLLRKSKFIDLGDPVGKIVLGKIYRVVGNDLYIDFGWKFPAVCSKPLKKNEFYVNGATVKLLIKDLELSTKFLGAESDTTLLEADCVLLGVVKKAEKNTKQYMDEIFD